MNQQIPSNGADAGQLRRIMAVKLVEIWNSLDDEAYFKAVVSYEIAPALIGARPASLLNLTVYRRNLYQLWDRYGHGFVSEAGIDAWELRRTGTNRLFIFYKPKLLKAVLSERKVMEFLSSFGYCRSMGIKGFLNKLGEGFKKGCPHEVGVFLGIPPEDVMSFICNRGRSYLFSGYWKVYHNPKKAERLFKIYDLARIKALSETIQGQIMRKQIYKLYGERIYTDLEKYWK